MDITKHKKIHIIGIEGAGTSALARILAASGARVTGTDEGDHFYADMLAGQGIEVKTKFDPANIPADTELIIYSTAFKPETNVELKAALAKGKPVLKYAEALGSLIERKYTIAVCGSHGKTTTTAWLAFVLDRCGLSPSAIVGSKVPQWSGNSLSGSSDYLVVEADEYQNKLADYRPRAVLLNNIDYDHPDFFLTKEDYQKVFIDFIKKIPSRGFLVANYDDPAIRRLAAVNCRAKVVSYAINEAADFIAYQIKTVADRQYFKVKLGTTWTDGMSADMARADEQLVGDFAIRLFGRHNVYNALAVIATALELNIPLVSLRTALEEFTGTVRRLEEMGIWRGATLVNDYAHHPSEIKASLAALRERYPGKRLWTVFMPHTFTRTKALLDDFAASFKDTDELILMDIYGSARETQGGIHTTDLLEKIRIADPQRKAVYKPNHEAVEEYLREKVAPGDLIVFMGAGDAYIVGERLLK